MPTYNLTAGMVSDTPLTNHSTPYTFANGSLDSMACGITAVTDGLDSSGQPYGSGGSPAPLDLVDIGSTMIVGGTSYVVTDELGSYGTIHYDNGSGPEDIEGIISHYTLTNGPDTIYVSFAVLQSGSPVTIDNSYELLGFTFDDDISMGPDRGLMPMYDNQGQLEWGTPDGVTKIPCFAEGTEIETDRGPVKIEDLVAGDMIRTHDNGLQEVKMIASSEVAAKGDLCPVVFETGAIGNDKPLIVSQQHRMFIGGFPEYLRQQFGPYQNNFIQAVELCNGGNIHLATDLKTVRYFHLMFDDHQLLYAHGTISESWQPTKSALKHHPELAKELNAIFPGIADRTHLDKGAMARQEISVNPERIKKMRKHMKAA